MVDIKKLKKNLTKIDISTGISEPDEWLSTGNYALNFNITGNFKKGIPNRRTLMLYGLQGSGKSYLACLAAKQAQDKGYFVIYIDTEHALHEDYLHKIGMDMSDDKFLVVNVFTLEEITKTMSEFFQFFSPEDKVCYIVDSLGMMETEKEQKDFEEGKITTDMGLFAKRLKFFMKNINGKIGDRDNFFICTNHCYLNQDIKNGKGTVIVTGGEGFQYIPSISVFLSKLKLKEATDTVGIRLTAETTKSRFTQLGRKIRIEVPYDKGIDPIDGLLDMAVEAGLVDNSKKGWYGIIGANDEMINFRAKEFHNYYNQIFDIETDNPIVEMDEDGNGEL